MKKSFSSADDLDGFDELQSVDQEKIRKAWEDGHVADEDIPETARKAEGDDDAEEVKPKKKRASAKKDDDGEPAKPKKARTSKKASCCRSWCFSPQDADLVAIYRSQMKKATRRTIAQKRRSPRKPLRQSLVQRQTLLQFLVCTKERSYQYFQKSKDEDEQMNGDEGGEEKPKKKGAPPKKAPAGEKKVAERKAPAKKRAPKKVLFPPAWNGAIVSHVLART